MHVYIFLFFKVHEKAKGKKIYKLKKHKRAGYTVLRRERAKRS